MSAFELQPVPLGEDGYFAVLQPRNEPQIKDFLCDLSFKFEGDEIYKGQISVNNPFKLGSYYFYHNNFSRDDIEFVNLTVVYDPGYRLVLVGFFLLIIGVIHALFIKPLFGKEEELPFESVSDLEIDENGPQVRL
jgi:cytochrome c biogenesis protein ResB